MFPISIRVPWISAHKSTSTTTRRAACFKRNFNFSWAKSRIKQVIVYSQKPGFLRTAQEWRGGKIKSGCIKHCLFHSKPQSFTFLTQLAQITNLQPTASTKPFMSFHSRLKTTHQHVFAQSRSHLRSHNAVLLYAERFRALRCSLQLNINTIWPRQHRYGCSAVG